MHETAADISDTAQHEEYYDNIICSFDQSFIAHDINLSLFQSFIISIFQSS